MITDLEKSGFVITSQSVSFLAEDPRTFKFIKNLGDTFDPDRVVDGQEWQVDCLGTKLCMDITLVVENIWGSIAHKS